MTAAVTLVAMAGTASAGKPSGPTGDGSEGNPYTQSASIPICHRTNSDSNPYGSESPDFDSIVKRKGHGSHTGPVWNSTLKDSYTKWGDIIPSFWYQTNKTTKTFYPGLNWNIDGQKIYNNNCAFPSEQPPTESDTATLTLVKKVADANGHVINDADVSLWTLTASSEGQPSVSGTSPASGTVTAGVAYQLSESPGSIDGYENGSQWSCVADKSKDDDEDKTPDFTMNGNSVTIKKGKSVTCTITNTKLDEQQQPGHLTLVKKVVDESGNPVNESLTQWTLVATSEGEQLQFASGDTKNVVVGAPYGLSENSISGYTNGTAWDCEATDDSGFEQRSETSVVLAAGQHVTCTITNVKKTQQTGGDGGGTPPPSDNNPPVENNPPAPQVVTPAPVIEVQGVHAEVPPVAPAKPVVEVAGVSQTAAPSANAHTGQGQSPWVYLLFGLGALLMVGAVRARRSHGAR
jgi:hypothetical protein